MTWEKVNRQTFTSVCLYVFIYLEAGSYIALAGLELCRPDRPQLLGLKLPVTISVESAKFYINDLMA